MASSRSPFDDWRISPLSLVIAGVIRALAATVDFRHHGEAGARQLEANRRPYILAFWHRHLVLMRYAWRGSRMSVMVSQSWDGELTSRTLERLGIDTVRGSSSRGGAAALRDALRRAREGSDLTFTPDGPRGPLRVVQPGVVVAAALTGMPVVTTALAANRARTLRSWDRMLVPLPGSRVDIVYGEVMRFGRDEPVEAACARLGAELNRIEARAEALAAGATSTPGNSEGISSGTPGGSSTSSAETSYGSSEGDSTGSSAGTSYGTSEGGST